MKKYYAIFLPLCLVGLARSTVVVTEEPGKFKRDGVEYESSTLCAEAAKDGLGAAPLTCEQVNKVVIEGSCANVPMPEEPERTLDPHFCPGSDVNFWFTENHQVAVAYPKCWEIQAVVEYNVCNPPENTLKPGQSIYVPKWP